MTFRRFPMKLAVVRSKAHRPFALLGLCLPCLTAILWAFFPRNASSFASVSTNCLVMILMLSVFFFIGHPSVEEFPETSNGILSRPFFRSIQFRDLRSGIGETTFAVNHQEVTVDKADGESALADENIHPVMIVPYLADLHTAQVHRLTKSVDYLFSDELR